MISKSPNSVFMDAKHSLYIIQKMTENDIEPAMRVLTQSWSDTYINDDLGITKEWVEARNSALLSPEKVALRRARFKDDSTAGWVAKDKTGIIVGLTTPYTDKDGIQHLGSLYVDRNWHGKGVAGALLQKVINWFDSAKPITLGVATYNERARAFYRKWGFKEVQNSQTLFADKIPEIRMIRPAIDKVNSK